MEKGVLWFFKISKLFTHYMHKPNLSQAEQNEIKTTGFMSGRTDFCQLIYRYYQE